MLFNIWKHLECTGCFFCWKAGKFQLSALFALINHSVRLRWKSRRQCAKWHSVLRKLKTFLWCRTLHWLLYKNVAVVVLMAGRCYTKQKQDAKQVCVLLTIWIVDSCWAEWTVSWRSSKDTFQQDQFRFFSTIWTHRETISGKKKQKQNKNHSKNREVVHLVQQGLFHNLQIFSGSFCAWLKFTPSFLSCFSVFCAKTFDFFHDF